MAFGKYPQIPMTVLHQKMEDPGKRQGHDLYVG